jgi:hypothetical protein
MNDDVMIESFDSFEDLMRSVRRDEELEQLNHNQEHNIPRRTKDTIDNYVLKGWKPGGFVHAMLANDLKGACGAADSINRRYIFEICSYIYNHTPYQSQGSYQAVDEWLEMHRENKNDGL